MTAAFWHTAWWHTATWRDIATVLLTLILAGVFILLRYVD